MILASQLDVQADEKPAFPIYLTSVEGAGKERTVEPNSDILSFIEYVDKVSSFNDYIGHWELPIFETIFVIDGIPFTAGEGYGSNEQWDSYMLYANDYTGSGWWAGVIQRNGHIGIWDDK